MKKIYFLALILIAILLCLFGFYKININNFSNIKYQINTGHSLGNIAKIKNKPIRIISFSPVVTEIITAIGASDNLVGRTTYCNFPDKIKSAQVIGDIINQNLELIIKQKPDLVISLGYINSNTKQKLKNLNINLLVIKDAKNFEDIFNNIKLIGKALNKKKQADNLVYNINKRLNKIIRESKKFNNKPTACYIVDFKNGNFLATGDSFINDLIEKSGGQNIAKDGHGWTYSTENLFKKNPQIIFLNKQAGSLAEFKKSNTYKELDAVKNNNIYTIDANIINRSGPRIIEGLETMFNIFKKTWFK